MTIHCRRFTSVLAIACLAIVIGVAPPPSALAQPPAPQADPLDQPPEDGETQPGDIPPLAPGLEPAEPTEPTEPTEPPAEEGPPQEALDALDDAQIALFRTGDYDAGFKAIDEALAIHPDFPEAYLLRSFAHRLLGEYQQAIDAAARVIELDPEQTVALFPGSILKGYYLKGLAHIELNQTAEAVATADAALEINPEDANAMHLKGTAFYAAKNYGRAVTSLTDALGVSPRTGVALQAQELVTTYMRRAISWYHLGEYDIAIDDFDAVIRLSGVAGVQDEGYRWRGFVQAAQHDFIQAIHSYDRALHVNRQNSLAHKGRGIAYLNLATTRPHLADFANAEAVSSFNQMIRLDPDEARAYYYRGIAYARLGEPQMAHSSFSTAVQLDPDHAPARRERDALGGHFWPAHSQHADWVGY